MNALSLFIGLLMNNGITKIENPSSDKDLLWRRTDNYTDMVQIFISFIGNLLVSRGVEFELVKDGTKIRVIMYLFLNSKDSYQTVSIEARDVVQGEFLNFFKGLYKALQDADSKNNKTLQKIEDY